ncbi:MAG: GPO family capsid scaffolding protein [Fluviibacter sp.]
MAKSKFFRVAVEGATSDNREISRQDIEQMAKNYNPSTYGARVWMEHLRSAWPDSSFRAYGDVVAVKTEEVDINGEMKLALFAQLDPTQDLITLVNKLRQKVYTSIEIQPNFAKTGEAYLVGLAVTDSPASLGTEMLAFARQAEKNPLSSRKQDPENLFTAAEEVTIEFETEAEESIGTKVFNKIMGILGKKSETDADRFSDIEQSVTVIAESQREQIDRFAAHADENKAVVESLKADLESHKAEFKALTESLSKQDPGQTRNPATGGDKTAIKTDC